MTGSTLGNGATLESKVTVAPSMEEAMKLARGPGRVFIIGGAELYGEAIGLPECERILFTEVKGEVETDVDFPVDFRESGWVRASHEKLEEFVGGGVERGYLVDGDLSYEFQMWERQNTKID